MELQSIEAFPGNLAEAVRRAGGVSAVIQAVYPALDEASLYAWMRGKSFPSLKKLPALVRALGVSIESLLGIEVPGVELSVDRARQEAISKAPGIDMNLLAEILNIAGETRSWKRLSREERARRVAHAYEELTEEGELKPKREGILRLIKRAE